MSNKLKAFMLITIGFLVFFSGGLSIFPRINFQIALVWVGVIVMLFLASYIPFTRRGGIIKLIGLALLMLFFLSVFWMLKPASLNPQEKQYIKHFDSGYEYFRARDYEKALSEYNLAQGINNDDIELYERKALCYERLKEYDKAIAEAQEALKHDPGNSLYKKAKGFRLINNDEVSIYTIIGESNYKLGNYQAASEAFTEVINQTTYQYSDVYFKRGKCEYHLGNYQKALTDFNKHKGIINQYLQDQRESKYRAKHPTYTNKDLAKLEEWIKACKK